MDKYWDRKSFEVGGHWPLWRGWNNRMTTKNRQKSNAKKQNKTVCMWCFVVVCVVVVVIVSVAVVLFDVLCKCVRVCVRVLFCCFCCFRFCLFLIFCLLCCCCCCCCFYCLLWWMYCCLKVIYHCQINNPACNEPVYVDYLVDSVKMHWYWIISHYYVE